MIMSELACHIAGTILALFLLARVSKVFSFLLPFYFIRVSCPSGKSVVNVS